ncbi:DUF349 domain-containing protein [Alkalimarinus sediminis]|uniref:DUF349 domain-containing protein n=1 Tax=Alkalimarinus sediminis TaxID=1632866 RepID=A0A9E8HM82_9ALTE|nr:DUF349 domain-containing protein [Alkalimarinus sediminis]UZW76697.1 DUF349 domain-containing protein [Alkalimarinus sediminis]
MLMPTRNINGENKPMSAFLKKLFKPKWKSSNAITRKEYISALNPSTEEDRKILLDLARNDSDNQVRRAAIKKIDSVNTLLSLYQDPSNLIKPAVKDRLEELAKSNSLPIYEIITDESLLVELVTSAETAEQYLGALSRLSASSLESIATDAKLNQLRLSAVELVTEEASLATIEKQAKNKDKRVYQVAKSKLKEIKESKRKRADALAKQETLISSLEAHAKSETVKLYSAKLNSLLDTWNQLGECLDESLIKRFDASKTACELKAEHFKQEQTKAELEQQRIQEQASERTETLNTLEQTFERFKQTPFESASELSALDAIIKTQETRWLEATKNSSIDKAEQKQYQQLMNDLKHYLKSAQCFMGNKDQFAALQDKSDTSDTVDHTLDLKKISHFINQVDWPSHFAAPPLFKALSKAAGNISTQKQKTQQNTDKLQHTIEEQLALLEKDLNNRALKPSALRFKELNQLVRSLDKPTSGQYTGKLQLLGKQLDELKDWYGYAVTPKQNELCEQIERLAEQHLEPQTKADKIKELQDEWKKLGGSSDQKVWLRFKAGCDAAYAPCKDYFEEQKSLKKSNIEKRKTICQQLSDFVNQNDWHNTDWKAVEKINRTAREEWKSCYPVEFKENKQVQKTFNELLAKLDQYLDDERERNKQLKQDIVEKAQSLITHEPLSEAIESAKTLQSEWQKVGITLHKDDRALWKEYRAACDEIFKRRDEANESKQHAINEALAQADALCEEAECLSEKTDTVSAKTLADLRQRFKEISPIPKKEHEKLAARLDNSINYIKSEQDKRKAAEENALWLDANRKSKLIRDAAETLHSGGTIENIAELTNEISSSSEQAQPITNALLDVWTTLTGDTPLAKQPASIEQAKTICIQCEIAAEIESPEEDQALRMQLQVNRLSQGINNQQDGDSKKIELEKHLLEWFQLCLLPKEVRAGLEARIDNVLANRT